MKKQTYKEARKKHIQKLVKMMKKDFKKRKKEKQFHIVNLDSVGAVGLMPLSYIYDDFKLFIQNRIHVHTYSRQNIITEEEFFYLFRENSEFTRKYKDVLNSQYFHLHLALNPKEIVKEVSKYDYGLNPSGEKSARFQLKNATGNKMATYLEAGLPILSEAKMQATCHLIKNLGVGIVYDEGILKNIRPILENTNYKKLQENVLKARRSFSMEKQFPKLLSFMEQVVENCKRTKRSRLKMIAELIMGKRK